MPKLIIVYDSKTGNTGIISRYIEEGAKEIGVETKIVKVGKLSKKDIENADAIIIGSPTYYHGAIDTIRDFTISLKNYKLKGKIGGAFTSYGWSDEASRYIAEGMRYIGMKVIAELKIKEFPIGEKVEECRELGRKIAREIKK